MTKEYLKMADVFNNQDSIVPESKMVEYAAHAISSHDELVEEVARLRIKLNNSELSRLALIEQMNKTKRDIFEGRHQQQSYL